MHLRANEGGSTPQWIYWGAGAFDGVNAGTVNNGAGSATFTNATFELSFEGTTKTQALTMYTHANKGEVNYSNNPTFIKHGQDGLEQTSSHIYQENSINKNFREVFYENEKVLLISTHQYPFYPGGGTDKDKGDFNNSLNIPLPAGTNSQEYLNAFDRVLERLVQYKPDFLLFSAGFDAHKDDPLAQFQLSSKDFYEITKRTLTATNKFTAGKVVSILEGGYDLNALAESANEHVNALVEFN